MPNVQDVIPESAVARLLDEVRQMEPDFSSSLYPKDTGEVIRDTPMPEFAGQIMAKIAEYRIIKKNSVGYTERIYGRSISTLEALLSIEISANAGKYIHTHKVNIRTDGMLIIR